MRFAVLAIFFVVATTHSAAAAVVTHPIATPAEDSWRVDQPNVKARLTEYPQVVFRANDTVVVNAGGCVQTGGVGKTWKLYVDPRGKNSGSFYHGLIQLPAATIPGSPVRISTIVGATLVVPSSSPGGDLKLGYEDDGYSDNGYDKHDDGTGDQCKGIGPAWVTVDIKHNATPPSASAQPLSMFDLVWSASDDSGFPLNPIWAAQIDDRTNLPVPQICLGYPQKFGDPHCSHQSPSLDVATSPNSWFCRITGEPILGHVNWFPVSYVGSAEWSDHSSNDDDYNFTFQELPNGDDVGEADVPSNRSIDSFGVSQASLGLEFDSDETIDHFKSHWWSEFHDAVDSSSTQARAMILPAQGSNASVTGLLGLDCEHTCRTEIHPVYSMAMEVFDPSDKTGTGGDVYAIFARNYGDEGYCSSFEHEIDVPRLSVRIPWRAGATGVTILNKPDNSDGYFRANNASIAGPNVSWVPGQGILVQFDVPPGLTHAMVNGELHVVWIEASGAGSKRAARPRMASATEEEDGGEEHVENFYDALDAGARQRARTWKRAAIDEPDALPKPRHAPIRLARFSTIGRSAAPPRDITVKNPAKIANDVARVKALCAAYEGKITRPRGACP